MRKIFLVLSAISLIVLSASVSFAYDEIEARGALITYSGTEAFTNLLPEERRACMLWVSEGGKMSETCRSAVTRLISEDPDAVTPSQRKALLAAAAGINVQPSAKRTPAKTTPAPKSDTVIRKDDNTGAIIAAGIVGIIAGMIIHNNWPGSRGDTVYCPPRYRHRVPSPHYRPAPHYRVPAPKYRPAPHYRVPHPVARKTPPRIQHRSPAQCKTAPRIRARR